MPDSTSRPGGFAFRRLRRAFALTVPAALLGLAGCSRDASPAASSTVTTPRRYDVRGEILALVPDRRVLVVHHEEIPGYMPEMTMEFTVVAADFAVFKAGQRIAARMFEAAPGEFHLEGIRLLDAVKDQIVIAAAEKLREDTFVRGKNAYREVGEEAPRFTLYNQLGEVVSFDRFRGQRVVLNFIFTRCPVATMCPASTAKMATMQRLARERGIRDFQLVSITLDPAYDTPPVLKAYAEGRGLDASNFNFLTGPEPAIRSLLTQFGVIAEPSADIWKHTLATLLIGRDGKIIHRIDGSVWDPEDILKRL
jgi:protein SCO1/2